MFCDLPNDSFAEKCCKSLLFRRKNRYRAAFGFRDICACLVCRQVGAQHEKSCFELQFQGLSTEDIELSVSDSLFVLPVVPLFGWCLIQVITEMFATIGSRNYKDLIFKIQYDEM